MKHKRTKSVPAKRKSKMPRYFFYSGTPPYDHPVYKTTSLLRPYSFKPNVKTIESFYYFEDPVNATTSLLRPGFYGPTVVALTGFHCNVQATPPFYRLHNVWIYSNNHRPNHLWQTLTEDSSYRFALNTDNISPCTLIAFIYSHACHEFCDFFMQSSESLAKHNLRSGPILAVLIHFL